MRTFIVEIRKWDTENGLQTTILVVDALSKAEAKTKATWYMVNTGWMLIKRIDPDYRQDSGELASEWFTKERFCDRV